MSNRLIKENTVKGKMIPLSDWFQTHNHVSGVKLFNKILINKNKTK